MSSSLREKEAEKAVSSPPALVHAPHNHTPGFWIWTWLPVALGIAMIMCESTEIMGANHTYGPLHALWVAIFGPISWQRWDRIHHFLRKAGHFLGYGAIGVAWLRAWWRSAPHLPFRADMLFALLGTAIIATCDEWHQSFLPNRNSSIWDVLLDCTGAFVLQLFAYAYLRLIRPRKLTRTV